jgi:hypothetical protein
MAERIGAGVREVWIAVDEPGAVEQAGTLQDQDVRKLVPTLWPRLSAHLRHWRIPPKTKLSVATRSKLRQRPFAPGRPARQMIVHQAFTTGTRRANIAVATKGRG